MQGLAPASMRLLALLGAALVTACTDSEPPAAPVPPPAAEVAASPATVPASATKARLTGDVVDYHGRPLAGAMVTARDDGRAMNVSVFTDGNGHYAFPELETGSWRVRVKRIGSEVRERTIALGAAGADVDFQLRLSEDPTELLPASYWYDRIPWPDTAMRANFALACANCHQIGDPLWRKSRTPVEWEAVVARMEFRGPPLLPAARERLIPTLMETFGTEYDFELPPAPTGDAVRAVIWEYEVDPQGRNGCHDLELGLDGTLWTEDGFAVNPETLERRHVAMPAGSHSIERAPGGDMWVTVTGVDLMSRIDVETGEVEHLEHPEHGDDKGVYPHTLRFDDAGILWYTLTVSNHIARLDTKTREFRYYDLPVPGTWEGPYPSVDRKPGSPIPVAYGLDVAPDQRIWFSQLLGNLIGVLDPKTGEIDWWRTPVEGPRRLRVGPDGAVWVPGYGTSNIGRFDPATEQWKLYDLPTRPHGSELPYALTVDHETGHVWVAGSNSDTLIRFEPESEQFTSFPLATAVDFSREIEIGPDGSIWTCVPDRGTGPEGPLSGRFVRLQLLEREGSCGDGQVQLGEQCDDGGLAEGDGCDAQCQHEPLTPPRMAFQD
jgi:cysteine-rich repeat protein